MKRKSKHKTTKTTKKPAPKPEPKPIWDRARVRALYELDANTPKTGPHAGEPHEYDEIEDPSYGPMCLACNTTGDDVEKLDREGPPDDERDDEFRFNDDWD